MDRTDRAILKVLQTNGRLSNIELADQVALSPSACLRRVRTLEDSGVIAGYAMLPNPVRLGFTGVAFIQITLDRQNRDALERFERAVVVVPEVLSCYLLAGQADYLLHVVYRDSADLERIHNDVFTHLPGVVQVRSTLALRSIKVTGAYPI